MGYSRMTDREWEAVAREMPGKAATGRPRKDYRRTVDAILYVLITGRKWMDLPKAYGSKSTAHRLLLELEESGAWSRVLARLARGARGQRRADLLRAAGKAP